MLKTDIEKDVVIIEYPFSWGGQYEDRWMWQATKNGEVIDYHTKDYLIKQAKNRLEKYAVIRHHLKGDKKGTITILLKNY